MRHRREERGTQLVRLGKPGRGSDIGAQPPPFQRDLYLVGERPQHLEILGGQARCDDDELFARPSGSA